MSDTTNVYASYPGGREFRSNDEAMMIDENGRPVYGPPGLAGLLLTFTPRERTEDDDLDDFAARLSDALENGDDVRQMLRDFRDARKDNQ